MLTPVYQIGDLVEVKKSYFSGEGEIIKRKVRYEEKKMKVENLDARYEEKKIEYLVRLAEGDERWYLEEELQLIYKESEMDKFLVDLMLRNYNKYPEIIDRTLGRIDLDWNQK